jgi:hypothetical protein
MAVYEKKRLIHGGDGNPKEKFIVLKLSYVYRETNGTVLIWHGSGDNLLSNRVPEDIDEKEPRERAII